MGAQARILDPMDNILPHQCWQGEKEGVAYVRLAGHELTGNMTVSIYHPSISSKQPPATVEVFRAVPASPAEEIAADSCQGADFSQGGESLATLTVNPGQESTTALVDVGDRSVRFLGIRVTAQADSPSGEFCLHRIAVQA